MSVLKAIILGIVQGVTEFLPVSSSGHLSLFHYLLGTTSDTSLLFDVMLHLGTLIAVFIVYYKTIWALVIEFFKLIKDIFTGKFKFKEITGTRKMLIMFVFSCIPLLFLLIPVGGGQKLMDVCGRFCGGGYPLGGGFAEDDNLWVEGFSFLLTAVLLLTSTYISKKKKLVREVNTTDAFAVGVAQAFAAAFPGLSRSGSTISTGMMCGVNKEYMVQYSFILGIPAIIAANISQTKDAIEIHQSIEVLPTVIGIITAMVVGVLCIKLLQWILKKDMFKYFGYYCIAIGIFTLACQIFKIHF